MAAENWLWGQKRIQAELARLGFKVSARTVAKYMRLHRNRGPSPGWRKFLKQHAPNIWACDFFCVHTILFQTLYVFFVIRLANREVLHVEVTRHPTAEWAAQQIVECCAWDRRPPRFLIHDRDSRYGMSFDRRVRHLGISQVRTPFRSPRANAIAERWVKSARTDWDRNQARPAVGEGFPSPALSIAGRVHIPTMADVSRRPPIIPDGRISRVRFETLAFLPWAFPKFGEV
jgi:transposase InsO family protein